MATKKDSTKTKAKAKTEKVEKPSNLCRALSTVFLINSEKFAAASPKLKTSTVAAAGTLPIEFVANFHSLADRQVIRNKLLSGGDAAMMLEFNGISLSDDELAALKSIKPVLAKINALGPIYAWLPEPTYVPDIQFTDSRVTRNGHFMSKATALKVWKAASSVWSGNKKQASISVPTDGSVGYYGNGQNRAAEFYPDSVKIGCQTVPRVEVEFIARHFGWDPVVPNG